MSHAPANFESLKGGHLMTRVSAEKAGLGNWTVRRDFRFDTDQDVRREGDVVFSPRGISTDGSALPVADEITLTFTARRANGDTALIIGTPTALYRYFPYESGKYDDGAYAETGYAEDLTGVWLQIGSGFSTSGHRWEARNINGTAVFNNGYDLPVSYRLEDLRVKPLYELREQGIAYVDTIEELGGVLHLFGVGEIRAEALSTILATYGYGVFRDPAFVNNVAYRNIWSHIGQPTRWGALFKGTVAAGSLDLTIEYAVSSLEAGMEILVTGAGEDGGNLVTTIQSISGASITMRDYAKTAVSNALVSRSDIEELIVGSWDLQDDASPVLRAMCFQERLVVFKASGTIFLGQYTGDKDNPYLYERVHRSVDGESVDGPFYRWAIVSPNGEYLLYPGRNAFYTFDLVSRRPVLHPELSLCDNLFFDAVSPTNAEKVFAADNVLTQEAWFCFPSNTSDKGICFDYTQRRVSTLGERYTAGTITTRPVAGGTVRQNTEDWFVLAGRN